MKFCIALVLVSVLALSEAKGNAPKSSEWESWKSFHGKQYSSKAEDAVRKSIFDMNKDKVHNHNIKFVKGEMPFDMELNQFADMTPGEFKKTRCGLKLPSSKGLPVSLRSLEFNLFPAVDREARASVPDSWDWREHNGVSPVKDQGQCGSCWAFATVATIESQQLIKNCTLVTNSEQQIVDCDTKGDDKGCNGGLPDNAFKYLEGIEGIESDADYPYQSGKSKNPGQCAYDASKVKIQVTAHKDVPTGNTDAIKQALYEHGPIAIGVFAELWQFYSSGTMYMCPPLQADHAVTLVGWKGTSTWIIKNSWAETWGEKGFIEVPQMAFNDCGVQHYLLSYPEIADCSANNDNGGD